jgi:hypothetical protein
MEAGTLDRHLNFLQFKVYELFEGELFKLPIAVDHLP